MLLLLLFVAKLVSNTNGLFTGIPIFQGLPVMPTDLETFNGHTKHCGSSWDDSPCCCLVLEFILTSLWDKEHKLLMELIVTAVCQHLL